MEAILDEARRLGARVITMGTRTRGRLPRLLLGSVARDVVRRAPCATLVVRGRRRAYTGFALGIDGSPGSRHAVDLVAGLAPPRGSTVTLVAIVEPMRLPSLPFMPASVRQAIGGEATAENARRHADAERHVAAAAGVLQSAGWTVRSAIREGPPLAGLLAATEEVRAHVLVVGARGVGGVERLAARQRRRGRAHPRGGPGAGGAVIDGRGAKTSSKTAPSRLRCSISP